MSVLASLAIGASRTLRVERSKVDSFGRRIVRVREALPERGVVGYVTDRDAQTNPRLWQFYQTQYFLAPLLVDLSADHDTVIGNFRRDVDRPWLSSQGLRVARDFGDGVMILTRGSD